MNNQELAFEKLSKLKVGALFMEMGTGKTKVALELINSKLHKVDYILWICPYSIKSEIEAERLKWYPNLKMDIIGVESISQSDRIYLEVYNRVSNNKTFMVVDESLKIKNKEAKRTNRILELGSKATYKLILNGTPISKNVLDLYTQMEFLSPKILNMSFNEFKNTYCEYYLRGRLKNLVKKQHNIEHLISKIKPYIFDSELELNAHKNYYSYSYNLENREEYEGIKMSILRNPTIDFMVLSTTLQHLFCESDDRKKVLNALLEKIEGSVIIFVKFLTSIPNNAKCIIGEMNQKERTAVIQEFKNNKFKELYITYGCGSFGLNLQFCKNIIFLEHTFDYAVRLQAEARIYRLGQSEDVNYYDINCNVGLEKMIKGSLDKKSNLLTEIKKEIEKKGVEEWVRTI